jgi:1-deoxy-D-xylulose-5-phosphate synthase
MSAGLAKQGMLPVAAIYSTFLQRAYDMLLHDVALQGLHVVLAVDHTGLVGEDGETHHGVFDVGYLRQVPGMRVYAPASHGELRQMLRAALYDCSGPVAIRYPRGHEGAYTDCAEGMLLKEGTDCTVLTYGTTVNQVFELDKLCAKKNISLEILKPGVIAPLDFTTIDASVRKTGRLLVAEECNEPGCLADEIFAHLACAGIPVQGRKRNLGGRFFPHGTVAQLQKLAGLDAESLLPLVLEVMEIEK